MGEERHGLRRTKHAVEGMEKGRGDAMEAVDVRGCRRPVCAWHARIVQQAMH